MPSEPYIFVSYRRDDAEPEAGRLTDALRKHFGNDSVFFDSSSLRWGAEWPTEIEHALAAAKGVVVVIGPDWIRQSDEWGQRRLDQTEDWVRREIERALAGGKNVLPLLVRGARLPPPDKLPSSLAPLTNQQGFEIRGKYWDHDIKLLLSQLELLTHGHHHEDTSIGLYPTSPPDKPDPISEEKLELALSGSLSLWRRIVSRDPESGVERAELYRSFKFKSFIDAVSFMNQVAPGCDIAIHHPRWENIWKTVRVYLTTWDIGHQISDRDIQLAKYFDRAFREFPGAASASRGQQP